MDELAKDVKEADAPAEGLPDGKSSIFDINDHFSDPGLLQRFGMGDFRVHHYDDVKNAREFMIDFADFLKENRRIGNRRDQIHTIIAERFSDPERPSDQFKIAAYFRKFVGILLAEELSGHKWELK